MRTKLKKYLSSYKYFLGAFGAFIMTVAARDYDRKGQRERGDMQKRDTGWIRTQACCYEDTASAHGALALSTDPQFE